VNNPAKALTRRFPLLLLLFILAIWRAERGVAEIQGHARAPSQFLRISRESGSEDWVLTFLGRDTRISSEIWRQKALEQLNHVKEALP
jgi:hypothetical protein